MELHELLRHVADNAEAGRPAGHGLLYRGEPSREAIPDGIIPSTHQNYELAPRTVVINGIKVTAGVEEIEKGALCYIVNVANSDFVAKCVWGKCCDKEWLDRGLVFTDKKNAIAMAKAMLSFHSTVTYD